MTTCTKVVLYVPWIAVRARACRTGASDARALCDARRAVRAPKVKDNIQTVIVGTNKVLVQTARPKGRSHRKPRALEERSPFYHQGKPPETPHGVIWKNVREKDKHRNACTLHAVSFSNNQVQQCDDLED